MAPRNLRNAPLIQTVEHLQSSFSAGDGAATEETTTAVLQERIDQLIRNYRVRGHMAAQLDPLGIPRRSLLNWISIFMVSAKPI